MSGMVSMVSASDLGERLIKGETRAGRRGAVHPVVCGSERGGGQPQRSTVLPTVRYPAEILSNAGSWWLVRAIGRV